ncbi:fasciclin domain-containing protein [Coleofasciculus sp. FACHB-712]|uniref:fasciclin domain-containing protein n=1 Tax=Cyanophyceae TaxID=3028117 RepID=UPI001686AFEB|nr:MULTISPECIES: fasciclin domain-containing protein [unclassified Coleofasciculus]MBD1894116.1 fasciclin domain-containing protein [Coleofasciculus sp. FACHB-129]MBD1942811.1 fasciclin domain-containing protein [Coleofasciculus sp. FACHB-712]
MTNQKRNSLIKQLASLMGVIGASTLMGLPAGAQVNPNPEILQSDVFSKPPYNRDRSAQSTPRTVPSPTAIPSQGAQPKPSSTDRMMQSPSNSTQPPATEGMMQSPSNSTQPPATEGMMPAPGEGPDPAATQGTMPSSSNLVALAAQNGSFKILTAALEAAGLTETLEQQGPFTVFAPTDAAFAALPEGTVEKLLQPENKAMLVQILTYHVIPGKVSSSQLKSGEVTTVEGSPVTVKVGNDGVMVGNANVSQANIEATNGIIHAIDKVIMPPMPTK